MKIYFNRRPALGPWGGGSKVLSAIIEECLARNYQVFFEEEITKKDFDIIFCIDPRPSQFVDFNSLLQKRLLNPKSKLIQRVGDLGTHGKPELFDLVKITSQISDFLIFPSEWAKDYLQPKNSNYAIIQNAPLKDFIVTSDKKVDQNLLSIVSHHWSNNSAKGFEIYKFLDEFCNHENDYEFTFIGRKPENLQIKNYVHPLDVEGLVKELPKHNVYITASKLEAGANHVLEAMALGLPVLYHKDGGSINEYCKNFGMMYSTLEELVFILKNRKKDLLSLNVDYKRSSKDMAEDYVNLFEDIHES
jgi:hypothetical protein